MTSTPLGCLRWQSLYHIQMEHTSHLTLTVIWISWSITPKWCSSLGLPIRSITQDINSPDTMVFDLLISDTYATVTSNGSISIGLLSNETSVSACRLWLMMTVIGYLRKTYLYKAGSLYHSRVYSYWRLCSFCVRLTIHLLIFDCKT